MKLSEAIRLGAMLKPQVTGLFNGHGTCAIGAALDAVGVLDGTPVEAPRNPLYAYAGDRWPVLDIDVTCPVRSVRERLMEAVWFLNDSEGWTREQIADWVATIEAQHEAPQPAPALAEQTA